VFKNIKSQLILFLILFSGFFIFKERDFYFLYSLVLSTGSCVLFDTCFKFLKEKKFIITSSSVITGLILGIVLASDQQWWTYFLAALASIGSKNFIRIKGNHLFNPAAFGIVFAILLFGANTQWKGTFIWYILAPIGLYFINKIKKLELLTSYFLVAFVLFFVEALLHKTPILNILWMFNYFFIFIMLIEPKTTPIKRVEKILFGACAAIAIFVFSEIGLPCDVELSALLVLNLIYGISRTFKQGDKL